MAREPTHWKPIIVATLLLELPAAVALAALVAWGRLDRGAAVLALLALALDGRSGHGFSHVNLASLRSPAAPGPRLGARR